MTTEQHEYLVDNCLQQLKNIESDYKNDNVQIRIRQKEFYAPQYRIEAIKQHINELIYQSTTFTIQKLENSVCLTDDDSARLNEIAKKHCCRIERIESNVEMQIHPIPKALITTSATSSLFIQQSNTFCSSLSVKKMSVLNGSIEVYTPDYSMPCSVRALQERIETALENGFFDTSSGRKIIFCRWPHRASTDSKAVVKLKRFIGKFISYVAETITTNCPDAEKIEFSTCGWESLNTEAQFAEELIIEMKRVLEVRRSRWRFLLIFNHRQNQLCKEFHQAMVRLQSDEDGFVQFPCSVSIGSLMLVVDDLEAILRGENPDNYMDPDDREKYSFMLQNEYSKVIANELLHCIQRWLKRSPNVMKKNVAPFTPTGDINDALFTMYQPSDYDWWKSDYETFDSLQSRQYFATSDSNEASWFTDEQAHDYFQLFIKATRRVNIIETKLEENETAWETVSISDVDDENPTNDDDDIEDQLKTPEELKKIQELDDPHRKWKRKKRVTEAFMKQKIRNIIEFQQLCYKQANL
ncbi:unnamed protein product [Rotaria sp. Silwood1]|nr:unnamed protein product [Rotaria sp. Silwood1]